MENVKSLKKEMIMICHQMYKNGFINATDGNVSAKFQKHEILITRSRAHKGFLTEEVMMAV
jgi:ribulose-5-phosphate 4-epimerase/fuculose-1-phosphate aldolase